MCFSLPWVEHLLIQMVIIGAIVALVRLLLPIVLGWFGPPGAVVQRVIDLLMWAAVCIFLIIIIFDVISCLLSSGGGNFSLLPSLHR